MDMAMSMVPWLDQPVLLHSSRDAGKCKMTAEQCAFKTSYWLFWYEADHRYALPSVAFFLVAIGLFIMGHIASEILPRRIKQHSLLSRVLAGFRFMSYKGWRIRGWNTQSIGTFLLGAAGLVYFMSMTLGPRPYYWPNTKEISYGNSPPIATRTGYMALACMPFVIVLGAKANPITALTGISHEKLNIWHSWVAWAMFVLALVHTFPFIVFHIWKGDIVKEWGSGGVWVTGVVAIIAQAWLTFMSIPWIRNRYYEFFKATHFFMAMVFVIFFFFHCDFRMSSWDYFIATAVLYTLCWLYSQCKTYFEHGIRHKARLVSESECTLRITIDTRMEWGPGQHVFLRFITCGIHSVTAHPFTICSMPQRDGQNQLIFYVMARGGLTGRLMALSRKNPDVQIPVLIDGPYGGIPGGQLGQFEKIITIGGGAGTGLTLALIEEFISFAPSQPEREMSVVVTTRDPGMRAWYMQALRDLLERYPQEKPIAGLSIRIHETFTEGEVQQVGAENVKVASKTENVQLKESNPSMIELFNIQLLTGRPDLQTAIQQRPKLEGVSVGVVVCGPSSMIQDVREAASVAQRDILSGKPGCARELWLHSEKFSY